MLSLSARRLAAEAADKENQLSLTTTTRSTGQQQQPQRQQQLDVEHTTQTHTGLFVFNSARQLQSYAKTLAL